MFNLSASHKFRSNYSKKWSVQNETRYERLVTERYIRVICCVRVFVQLSRV